MTIEKITFSKKFPTGSYLNEDIGFECSIHSGDDPLVVIEKLRQLSENAHKEKYPHMYTESGSPVIVKQIENNNGQSYSEENKPVATGRRQVDKMPADKGIMKRYINAVATGDTKTIEKLKSQYDIKLAGDATKETHTESGQNTQ